MNVPVVFQEEFTNSLEVKKIVYCVHEAFGNDAQIHLISRVNLHAEYFQDADLVIVFGGDGTLLTATHFIKRGIIIGIHSGHQDSLGYFMPVDLDNLGSILQDYEASEEYIMTYFDRYHRLQATIEKASGTRIGVDYAFNEYAIGNNLFGRPSKYTIHPNLDLTEPQVTEELRQLAINGEFQRSSGILCSTFQGMTGWVENVMAADEFEMVMASYKGRLKGSLRQSRQLFFSNIHPMSRDYRFNHGFTNRLEIVSKMVGGTIALDGFNQFPFDRNDRIIIEVSDFPLWLMKRKE